MDFIHPPVEAWQFNNNSVVLSFGGRTPLDIIFNIITETAGEPFGYLFCSLGNLSVRIYDIIMYSQCIYAHVVYEIWTNIMSDVTVHRCFYIHYARLLKNKINKSCMFFPWSCTTLITLYNIMVVHIRSKTDHFGHGSICWILRVRNIYTYIYLKICINVQYNIHYIMRT